MHISVLDSQGRRPLFIDFDLYTDGDVEFKKELAILIIDNILELQRSLKQAVQQNNFGVFAKTYHKVKPTMMMLADAELDQTIESLLQGMAAAENQDRVKLLNSMFDGIIRSLQQLKY